MTKTGDAARPTPTIEPVDLAETWIVYQKPIIIGAIVLAAAASGVWLWVRSGQIKEEKATTAFQVAEAAFMSGNQQLAVTELEKIVTRYKGTVSGTQAAMLIAQAQMEQGKHADAVTGLQATLGSSPKSLKAGLYALLATAHEGAGHAAEAAATYGQAADAAEFETDKDMHRMEQARALLSAGDSAGALKLYQAIASRDDSPFSGEAKVRVGELNTKL